jgi:DNA-binding CsgD family transcriptional regulator
MLVVMEAARFAWRLAEVVEVSVGDPLGGGARGLELLMEACGASNGYFILATRRPALARRADAHLGFRIDMHHRVHAPTRRASSLIAEILGAEHYVRDQGLRTLTAASARPWVRRAVLVSEEARYTHSALVDLCAALELRDQLIGVLPLGADARLHFGIDRQRGERMFSSAERARLEGLLPALVAPFRRMAAARGVFDGRRLLSPREGEVLRALLTDRSEKEIAHALGLTVQSAHQLVVAIYRKLGVHGRVELLRRWLELGATDRDGYGSARKP